MLRTGLILSFFAIFNLTILVPAVHADIIPTRISDSKEDAQRSLVINRLIELGANPDLARAEANALTADDITYFAANPEAQKPVTGLFFEEWLLGAGFGLLILLVMFSFQGA